MSQSKLDRLVKMVNQIALNMSANGTDKMVADQVAQHLEKFWSPPMKNLITEQAAGLILGLRLLRSWRFRICWLCRKLSGVSYFPHHILSYCSQSAAHAKQSKTYPTALAPFSASCEV